MAHFELCNVETLCLTILMALTTSEVERKLISVILMRVSSGNGRIVSGDMNYLYVTRMGIRLGVCTDKSVLYQRKIVACISTRVLL